MTAATALGFSYQDRIEAIRRTKKEFTAEKMRQPNWGGGWSTST